MQPYSPKPFTIHRREGLFIQQSFGSKEMIDGVLTDVDTSEDLNVHMLQPRYNQIVYDTNVKIGATWGGTSDLSPKLTNETIDGVRTIYKSLKSTSHGAASFYLLPPNYNNPGFPHIENCLPSNELLLNTDEYDNTYNKLFEVSYQYHVKGSGEFKFIIDGVAKETMFGPKSWSRGGPWKIVNKTEYNLKYPTFVVHYRNIGLSDPPPFFEMDKIKIFNYVPIYCDMVNYEPPRADYEPTEIETLRGFKVFQQTKNIGTVIATTLRFEDDNVYNDFISNADKVHVISDDRGMIYRGVLSLGTSKRITSNLYELPITFKSPNKLGVGWE